MHYIYVIALSRFQILLALLCCELKIRSLVAEIYSLNAKF
ncbi:hypothetical protein T06_1591 [Trichinella sp. T6]|nr:hypothetical protein T06_1591 [Trichinella sp. T6]